MSLSSSKIKKLLINASMMALFGTPPALASYELPSYADIYQCDESIPQKILDMLIHNSASSWESPVLAAYLTLFAKDPHQEWPRRLDSLSKLNTMIVELPQIQEKIKEAYSSIVEECLTNLRKPPLSSEELPSRNYITPNNSFLYFTYAISQLWNLNGEEEAFSKTMQFLSDPQIPLSNRASLVLPVQNIQKMGQPYISQITDLSFNLIHVPSLTFSLRPVLNVQALTPHNQDKIFDLLCIVLKDKALSFNEHHQAFLNLKNSYPEKYISQILPFIRSHINAKAIPPSHCIELARSSLLGGTKEDLEYTGKMLISIATEESNPMSSRQNALSALGVCGDYFKEQAATLLYTMATNTKQSLKDCVSAAFRLSAFNKKEEADQAFLIIAQTQIEIEEELEAKLNALKHLLSTPYKAKSEQIILSLLDDSQYRYKIVEWFSKTEILDEEVKKKIQKINQEGDFEEEDLAKKFSRTTKIRIKKKRSQDLHHRPSDQGDTPMTTQPNHKRKKNPFDSEATYSPEEDQDAIYPPEEDQDATYPPEKDQDAKPSNSKKSRKNPNGDNGDNGDMDF